MFTRSRIQDGFTFLHNWGIKDTAGRLGLTCRVMSLSPWVSGYHGKPICCVLNMVQELDPAQAEHTLQIGPMCYVLHVAPGPDTPCTLDLGLVRIGPTDPAGRANLEEAPYASCTPDLPHEQHAAPGMLHAAYSTGGLDSVGPAHSAWAGLGAALHGVPVLDQSCALDPGPVGIRPTHWSHVRESAFKADLAHAPHTACPPDWPHILFVVEAPDQPHIWYAMPRAGADSGCTQYSWCLLQAVSGAVLDHMLHVAFTPDHSCGLTLACGVQCLLIISQHLHYL